MQSWRTTRLAKRYRSLLVVIFLHLPALLLLSSLLLDHQLSGSTPPLLPPRPYPLLTRRRPPHSLTYKHLTPSTDLSPPPPSTSSHTKKHSGFASPAVSALGLDKLGITKPTTIFRNLSYPDLAKHEEANKEVRFCLLRLFLESRYSSVLRLLLCP